MTLHLPTTRPFTMRFRASIQTFMSMRFTIWSRSFLVLERQRRRTLQSPPPLFVKTRSDFNPARAHPKNRTRVPQAFTQHCKITARYVNGILEVRPRHQHAMEFRQPVERNARVEVMLDVIVDVFRRDENVRKNRRACG